MKHNVEFKNFEPDQRIRKLIDELINKLEKRAKRFRPDEVFLRLMIEENSVRKLYHVSLVLEIPGKRAATKKTWPLKKSGTTSMKPSGTLLTRSSGSLKATNRL